MRNSTSLLVLAASLALRCHAGQLTCTVYDQSAINVVSNTCTAPDGVTMYRSSPVQFVELTPSVFIVNAEASYDFRPPGVTGPYRFGFSDSGSETQSFMLVGGTGIGYLEAFQLDANCHHDDFCGQADLQVGPYNRIEGPCAEFGCHVLIGPFDFNQPFSVTGTASVANTNVFLAHEGIGITGGVYEEIDILGIVDSSGALISGASLVELPEPTSYWAVLVGLLLTLFLGIGTRRVPTQNLLDRRGEVVVT
jgi:hypothetical protein